jgi:protocatechuate 3,4-dioxygenase beta subunit
MDGDVVDAREALASSDSELGTQDDVTHELVALHSLYERERAAGSLEEFRTNLDFSPYRSSILRHPTKGRLLIDPEEIELHSPAFGHRDVGDVESDLTAQHRGEPLGERIVVTGRILSGSGAPVAGQLVEVWQANSSGRYVHKRDRHPAPLDPYFTGVGRCLTDDNGWYRFTTIKPGAYPWSNHANAWRPAHIHFSIFGTASTQRFVTQMYFPGDPLFPLDPIYNAIVDPRARERLVASFDHSVTEAGWALGYRWDVVLSGTTRTWAEPEGEGEP